MFYIRKVFVTSLLYCVFSASVFATELQFITLEVPPWAWSNKETGKYEGMFPEIVEEISKRSGYKINIALTPYARINRELETARQDCTILISEDARSKITKQGELVFNHPMGVIAHKNVKLDSYTDLSELTISLLRGSTISKQFDTDAGLQKAYDTDYVISLNKIQHGRLEAVAGAIPTIQYLAAQKGLTSMLGKPLQLSFKPIYLQCANKSKNLQLMPELNKIIQDMHKDNSISKIIKKFTL